MRRSPTESDVAKLAGVSQSAVSRAFTPGASVAKETRERILSVAHRLGYQPNLMARSLATRRSNIIALAISSLENPFYAQVVKELSERLRETSRHILLFTTTPEGEADPALENVLSYQVDALILAATTASAELAHQCQKAGVPIVQINRDSTLRGISTVRGENSKAGETIADFLVAGGHKRFGFVGGPARSGTSSTRLDGYRAGLARAGIDEIEVAYGNYTFAGAAVAARELLSRPRRPDAIFCASDYMAFSVLDVAKREFGLNVPGDLSIVGFDDVMEAGLAVYDLTTYSQPAAALAEAALDIVDQKIAKPERRAQRREVPGRLIVRGSARKPEGVGTNWPLNCGS